MELRGCAKVRKVEKLNDRYYRISFSKDIPEGVTPEDGLENLTWYPQLIFRNNVIRNNRARSVLISSPGGALIEGNTFRTFDPRILNFYCVDGVTYRGNKVEMSSDYVYGRSGEAFTMNECDNVNIEE